MRSTPRARQPLTLVRGIFLVLGWLLLVAGGAVTVSCVVAAVATMSDLNQCVTECWHGLILMYIGLVAAVAVVVGLIGGVTVLLARPRRIPEPVIWPTVDVPLCQQFPS